MCSDIWFSSSVHIFLQKRLSAWKDHDFISFGDTILQNFLQFQNHYRLQSTLAPSWWRYPRQPPEGSSGCWVWSLLLLLSAYVECLGLSFYINFALPIIKVSEEWVCIYMRFLSKQCKNVVPIFLLYIKKFCVSAEWTPREDSLKGLCKYGRCFSLYSCKEEKIA